jgi:hypothetical protein
MFQMTVAGKTDEVFFHEVKPGEQLLIRGAYFVGSGGSKEAASNGNIDFFILNEERQVLFSRRKRSEGIFAINCTAPGEYMFIFSNLKV